MPMLSMMDAQMRTADEGVEDTSARGRPRRTSRRRPQLNEQSRARGGSARGRTSSSAARRSARRRRSRLRSRRSCQVGGGGRFNDAAAAAVRAARQSARKRSADEPTNASTSYVYLKVLASSLTTLRGAHSRPIAPVIRDATAFTSSSSSHQRRVRPRRSVAEACLDRIRGERRAIRRNLTPRLTSNTSAPPWRFEASAWMRFARQFPILSAGRYHRGVHHAVPEHLESSPAHRIFIVPRRTPSTE